MPDPYPLPERGNVYRVDAVLLGCESGRFSGLTVSGSFHLLCSCRIGCDAMGAPNDKLNLPVGLKRAIEKKRCVAFIGSGLSASAYGDWLPLIRGLCASCGIDAGEVKDAAAEQLIDMAEQAKRTNPAEYERYLAKHFGHTNNGAGDLLYGILLGLPFRSYLTTNFDPLLAMRASELRPDGLKCNLPPNVHPRLDRAYIGNRSIYYLHGYIPEHRGPPISVVLARSEFNEAYSDNSSLVSFLMQTFEYDPICFFGCRLQEPMLRRLFEICSKSQQKHLALMQRLGEQPSKLPGRYIFLQKPAAGRPDPNSDAALRGDAATELRERIEAEEGFYSGLNIQVIWYDGVGNDHHALRDAFRSLCNLPDTGLHLGYEGDADAQ